ncbi:MAG: IS66 family insertion sequence element accessory protein TnpB [Syntrophobacterales bacterium]|jgi:transposase|nr:IS66 family insertion sequence element accessory protein TnpB [Syntrophobacterales bacterium]
MLGDGKKVYLACGATDLRKNIDALSALVKENFKLDPHGNTMFVFCNRSRDIIKILEWDEDGFWLHMKKIEHGRFNWPDTAGDAKTMDLTYRELEILISSTRLRSKLKRRNALKPDVA